MENNNLRSEEEIRKLKKSSEKALKRCVSGTGQAVALATIINTLEWVLKEWD